MSYILSTWIQFGGGRGRIVQNSDELFKDVLDPTYFETIFVATLHGCGLLR